MSSKYKPTWRCRLLGHRWVEWQWWGQPRGCMGYLERRKCKWCLRSQVRQVPQ